MMPTVSKTPTLGQRVRVYSTFFSEQAPNDLNLNLYYEGVITRKENLMEGCEHYFYKIDKLFINNKPVPDSWRIGTEADFYVSETHPPHYVFEVTKQLELL